MKQSSEKQSGKISNSNPEQSKGKYERAISSGRGLISGIREKLHQFVAQHPGTAATGISAATFASLLWLSYAEIQKEQYKLDQIPAEVELELKQTASKVHDVIYQVMSEFKANEISIRLNTISENLSERGTDFEIVVNTETENPQTYRTAIAVTNKALTNDIDDPDKLNGIERLNMINKLDPEFGERLLSSIEQAESIDDFKKSQGEEDKWRIYQSQTEFKNLESELKTWDFNDQENVWYRRLGNLIEVVKPIRYDLENCGGCHPVKTSLLRFRTDMTDEINEKTKSLYESIINDSKKMGLTAFFMIFMLSTIPLIVRNQKRLKEKAEAKNKESEEKSLQLKKISEEIKIRNDRLENMSSELATRNAKLSRLTQEVKTHNANLLRLKLEAESKSIKLEKQQRAIKDAYRQIRTANLELEQAHQETIEAVAVIAEERDKVDCKPHIRRSRYITQLTAKLLQTDPNVPEEYKLSNQDINKISKAAALHDIGKTGTPDEVLFKEGKLNPEEWVEMKKHTTIGHKIISSLERSNHEKTIQDILKHAKDIALSHHECWDGSGYPNGIKDKDIPLSARILSPGDVFDAISHPRIYRQSIMSDEKILHILQEGSGSKFDPVIIDLFIRHFDKYKAITKWLGDNPCPQYLDRTKKQKDEICISRDNYKQDDHDASEEINRLINLD